MFRPLIFALFAALSHSTMALTHGVDSASLVSTSTFQKVKSGGFTRVIIRGFQESCGVGGRVDPTFVPTHKNAQAAGITKIDAYWFPCNGSGHKCKSYAAQIADLGNTIKANNLQIGRIWIDIEKDPACKNWNFGHSGNLAQAQELVKAARASGHPIGIYSSPGEWETLFGSKSVVLANDLPLWFATFDNVQTLTMKSPFGGWTSAFGKQYTDKSTLGKFKGQFDLSIFRS